mmetsp:Transcript_2400/g.6407  ORF Transcript_2400/g.6407 Transcript_2400/m.6407 type:complete len:128 (-) Transcript_2400:728-1111(-)
MSRPDSRLVLVAGCYIFLTLLLLFFLWSSETAKTNTATSRTTAPPPAQSEPLVPGVLARMYKSAEDESLSLLTNFTPNHPARFGPIERVMVAAPLPRDFLLEIKEEGRCRCRGGSREDSVWCMGFGL